MIYENGNWLALDSVDAKHSKPVVRLAVTVAGAQRAYNAHPIPVNT